MSVDTRTPRTPTGGSPAGSFDDPSPLNSVKVPSDPAQVIVNHVSFRVQLATTPTPGAQVTAAAARAAARPFPSSSPGAGGAPASAFVSPAGGPTAFRPSPPAPVAPSPSPYAAPTPPSPAPGGVLPDSARFPGARPPRRRAPVVWSGRAAPGDPNAGQLLRAVRQSTAGQSTVPAGASTPAGLGLEESGGATTQVLPRFDPDIDTSVLPTVVGPRSPRPSAPYAGGAPSDGLAHGGAGQTHDAYLHRHDDRDRSAASGPETGSEPEPGRTAARAGGRGARTAQEEVRHAYYPGRRMNLGIVLLPLRVFLGFISIYAGMGKLTDPVYFDGGERGSMVSWLSSLEPWSIASPLHDFAISHPVGAGLTVAFLQVIVGVLTVFGLWQRCAAGVGALLSAALLVTVSWNAVAAYDAPDIIYLAAWSPLIIAGAPVYSLDARLAGEAWRTLGPRSSLLELRRRVLRRGTMLVTLLVGLALLFGSMLGGAVRSAQVATVPEPGEPLHNQLPGSPLPQTTQRSSEPTQGASTGPTAGQSASPTSDPSTSAPEQTAGAQSGAPSQPNQEQTVQAPPEEQPAAPTPPPQPEAPQPTTGGGGDSGGSTGGDSGGSTGGDDAESGAGGSGGGALGGLLG